MVQVAEEEQIPLASEAVEEYPQEAMILMGSLHEIPCCPSRTVAVEEPWYRTEWTLTVWHHLEEHHHRQTTNRPSPLQTNHPPQAYLEYEIETLHLDPQLGKQNCYSPGSNGGMDS